MRVFRRIALEDQLEIEKLREQEKASYLKGEAGILYDTIKTDQETERKNKEKEDPEEGSPVSDTPDADVTGEADSPAESEEDMPAMEEIRNLSYRPVAELRGHVVALENEEILTDSVDGAKSMMAIGIQNVGKALSGLYKGVTYVAGKLIKLLFVSSNMLAKYIDRRVNSFENLKSSIQEFRKAVELVKSSEEKAEGSDDVQYTNVKVINSLKIGESVDFAENVRRLKTFTTSIVHGIDRQVINDISGIKHLIAMSENGTVKIPQSLMNVRPVGTEFQEGSLVGYPESGEFNQTYKYNEVLPSDVVLMATLPKPNLTDIDSLAKAYNGSSLTLGFDSSSFKELPSVNYMTADGLAEFLDSLEELCDACIAHQALYEKIARVKSTMKFTFKSYLTSLSSSPTKVSLKNSLIEYVYLKSVFVDKVYLVGAMDIHDYSSKVISFGLSFVKDNLKKLS